MGQEEDPLEVAQGHGPYFPMPPPFQTQKFGLAVQRTTSRGYHFWAVYTKVSRHYPKSQVTCPNI